MTKRDVADLILLWMAIVLFFALLASFLALGAIIGMRNNEYTDKSTAILFQIIQFVVLIFVNYLLFFKRNLILDLTFRDAEDTQMLVPDESSALTSYAFWIRLIGIYIFLTSFVALFSSLVMDVSTRRPYSIFSFGMIKSGTALISTIIAIVIIRKSEWISRILGGHNSSNHGLESTGAPPAAGTPETHP